MTDTPMFDPKACGLTELEADLCARVRDFGQTTLALRAEKWDREAIFPIDNYKDMANNGLLGVCIPRESGGLGADYRAYCLAAAEMGRYCGATALTWNMHVSSTLWTGSLFDAIEAPEEVKVAHNERRKIHHKRIIEEGAVYSQPFSEGGAAAAGAAPWSTTAERTEKGWVLNGKKIFASLSGHADYYGVLCTDITTDEPSRRNSLYLAVPANANGVSVVGDWDPLGMRGTVSRTLLFDNVTVDPVNELMPQGYYFQMAMGWQHMFLTLAPTYMGICQAAYDFTVSYLRGEYPGTPPVKRRMYPTKQIAVAEMQIKLEQTKALWFQVISEACFQPSKELLLRAYAAQYTVMENANDICRLAVRTCGGQSMLKSLPLERMYRDSRCGALMLPWTAELCLDRIGRGALYEPGEKDE